MAAYAPKPVRATRLLLNFAFSSKAPNPRSSFFELIQDHSDRDVAFGHRDGQHHWPEWHMQLFSMKAFDVPLRVSFDS